jgi:hypothetical protein
MNVRKILSALNRLNATLRKSSQQILLLTSSEQAL